MRRAGTWAARGRALLVAVALAGPARGAESQAPAASRAGAVGTGASGRAHAQADEPLPLALPEDAGAPVDEAQLHFRRGVQLYAAGNAQSALVELKRAYALVPSFRILFNLGQVAYQCGDHAAAFGYLTRYLTEGGAQVPDARRKEVAHDLADLRATVGYLAIETRDAGLRVMVDDVAVGITPLSAPQPANVGKRHIEVLAPSGERQSRVVDLAAGEILSVSFATLAPGAPAAIPGPPSGRRPSPAPERPSAGPAASLTLPPEIQAPVAPLPEIVPPAPPHVISVPQRPPPAPLAPGEQKTTAPAAAPVSLPPAPDRPRRVAPWLTWTLAAVAAGGAGATGALAWSTSQSLRDKEATYPVGAAQLQTLHDRERRYALASDGLLAGAVLLSALALYFTLSGSPASDGELTARADR